MQKKSPERGVFSSAFLVVKIEQRAQWGKILMGPIEELSETRCRFNGNM
jgi:hypothetical protein